SWLAVGDFVAPLFPIGLFFGRIGNFINAELWGKVTDVPWGVVFSNGGTLPRHPSQLYEALLEGLLLFVIILLYARKKPPVGHLSGLFLLGYAIARFMVEFVRVPDAYIGYTKLQWLHIDWLTRGQLLSLPMVIIGIYLLMRKPLPRDNPGQSG
ncbi:MAG: prolipoprotein diacylglyceryl transferase, partial [Gammaproteobacteria bacterium]